MPPLRSTLNNASRSAVRNSFKNLEKHFSDRRWIGPRNYYKTDCINRLSNSPRESQLAQYIAASAPVHCMDGWGFIGRALDCLAKGDTYVSRHLGYYAELRATMALLATEGIGIFNQKHFIINGNNQCTRISQNMGTHDMAWSALETWANLPQSSSLLGEIISSHRISLMDWMIGFFPGGGFPTIGTTWLKAWGVDLREISNDRGIRNEASYRPTRLNNIAPQPPNECIQFINEFWTLFEPSESLPFSNLDQHLARESLDKIYKSITGKRPNPATKKFTQLINSTVNHFFDPITSLVSNNYLKKFFTRAVQPETPNLIKYAEKPPSLTDPDLHFQIISRAALLLRIATGATAQLFKHQNLDKMSLDFWWKPLGEERGFWEPGNEPSNFSDLWADLEVVLNEEKSWREQVGSALSFNSWHNNNSDCIQKLGGCERIALWGFGF